MASNKLTVSVESNRQQIDAQKVTPTFEPLTIFLIFSNRAADWFRQGNNDVKREIVKAVASNLTLYNKILNIKARLPFQNMVREPVCVYVRARCDRLRTLLADNDRKEMIASMKLVVDLHEGGDHQKNR